jgi:hypothetical protein
MTTFAGGSELRFVAGRLFRGDWPGAACRQNGQIGRGKRRRQEPIGADWLKIGLNGGEEMAE